MDFWKHADGGLYSHAIIVEGKHPDTGEWVEGVVYRDATTLKPYWTTMARFMERFRYVELRTSHEQFREVAAVPMLGTLLAFIAAMFSFGIAIIGDGGRIALAIGAIFVILAVYMLVVSGRLESQYQWDSYARRLKEGVTI